MSIQKQNLVTTENAASPPYALNLSETFLRLYLNRDGDLLLFSMADNTYINWLSLTKTTDMAENEAIFTYLSENTPDIVSTVKLAMASTPFDYLGLDEWYEADLFRRHSGGKVWQTPFGHAYSANDMHNHGKYFARSLYNLPAELTAQCRFREADGAYAAVLDWCLREINTAFTDECPAHHYERVEKLVQMLHRERYLLFSERPLIRERYAAFMSKASSLYDLYADLI